MGVAKRCGRCTRLHVRPLCKGRRDWPSSCANSRIWSPAAKLLIAALMRRRERLTPRPREAARATITEIEAKLTRSKRSCAKTSPITPSWPIRSRSPSPDAQALLGEGQALVLFLDLWQIGKVPEETIVFALTKQGSAMDEPSFGHERIARARNGLRCGLDHTNWREGQKSRETCKKLLNTEVAEDRQPPFDAAAAHVLYRDLFGGVEDLIKDKSLLIVPSGALTQLPFEALVTEKPDESCPGSRLTERAAGLGSGRP